MGGSALPAKLEKAMQLHRAGDRMRAEELYRQVLAKHASHVVATHLLGSLLLDAGHDREAVDLLGKAVARAPANAPEQAILLANLGEGQRRLFRYADAIASLARATALRPDLAEAHYTLGITLRGDGQQEDAAASLERATKLKPTLTPAHLALSGAYFDRGRLDDALASCAIALRLDPSNAEAHQQMGFVLTELGRVPEGLASYRRALELRPSHAHSHSNLVYVLAFSPGETAVSILEEALRWGKRHESTATPPPPHTNEPDPERRLRIGYVSPDLRWHCQAFFLLPLLEHRHRGAAEVFAYSLVKRPDAFTDRIRGSCDVFRDVERASDDGVAQIIREDRIDVLVDLTMHMCDNRLGIFARKPAPVQVTWLAYPGTTGLTAIDYRITDPLLDPPGDAAIAPYCEQSVHLPDAFWCYDPLTRTPDVNPLPAGGGGGVTFGCLNSFKKTNAEVFALWARVLREVNGSRMLVSAQPGESRERVRHAFRDAGVAPERVEFVDQRPRLDYLALYHRIDICLDTFPYGGHTTSLDAFWMGVPVVTLVGRTVVGRAGLCLAHNLDLLELVAQTPEDFVAIASSLAHDLPRLSGLRAGLRQRMERSALMDAPRFARNLDAAYRGMWRRWCVAGKR